MAKVRNKITFPKKKEESEINLNQFIQNPTGKYSAQFARRDLVKANLEERFMSVLKLNQNTIDFKVYKVNGGYLFHFKMPSEEFKGELFYDACLFFTPTDESKGDLTINNYDLRFFSNSPAFVFTYAYVLYNSNMMIDFLAHKINDRALKEEPKVRNPIESLGFEKSCYFAALYMRMKGLNKKSEIENMLSKWDNGVIDSIKTDEGKLRENKRLKEQKSEEKKKEVEKKRQARNDQVRKQLEERRKKKGLPTTRLKHTTRKPSGKK